MTTFERYHEAVFGPHPTLNEIPHRVLRNYLDEQAHAKRFGPGLFSFRVTYSDKPLRTRITMKDG